jgi:hypothetical protein
LWKAEWWAWNGLETKRTFFFENVWQIKGLREENADVWQTQDLADFASREAKSGGSDEKQAAEQAGKAGRASKRDEWRAEREDTAVIGWPAGQSEEEREVSDDVHEAW